MKLRVAVDIGGTFTDIALIFPDGRLATRKVPSTPQDYGRAVTGGIMGLLDGEGLFPEDIGEVLHACTIATNAILEHKGAKTGLITTEGFRDVLEMRRIRMPRLYDPLYVKPQVLVPRRLRLEVVERMDPRGQVLTPLDEGSLERVIERLKTEEVEAIAVCLLHSYANSEHEQRIGERLRGAFPGLYVSLSSEVLPEIREYERTSTTVINSLVGPPMRSYLESLIKQFSERKLPGRILMMQSAGGMVEVRTVMKKPAQIVECGPAAGVIGARHVGGLAGYPNVISFDMGGTTAKASLIEKGNLLRTAEYEVGGGISLSSRLISGGGYALKLPAIDITEVGAGGGSIVWLDKGGALKVGPNSAGAVPGPVCYDMGGTEPTVTDANIVLGYLNPDALAGGTVPIQGALSHKVLTEKVAQPLGLNPVRAAHGVHAVVTTVMTRAVKTITTYRGRDPRDFSLFAFGGSGGIHAVSLARSLGIRQVVLPPSSGVFSALGLLFSDIEMNTSSAILRRAKEIGQENIEARYRAMEAELAKELGHSLHEVRFSRFADLRYQGQAFELTVPLHGKTVDEAEIRNLCGRFEEEHERTYGHRLDQHSIEFVTLRATASVDTGNPATLNRQIPKDVKGGKRTRMAYFESVGDLVEVPVIDRTELGIQPSQGPYIIEEYDCTTVVPPDCFAHHDDPGNIIIELPAPLGGLQP